LTRYQEFPDLEFIVQDISEDMMRQASLRKEMDGLEGRVTFMQHDFFEPQPIHDARAFFLRHISHNYVDSECVKILRALIPALEKRPGTPVLINDVVLPELNSKERYKERIMRQTDVCGARCKAAKCFAIPCSSQTGRPTIRGKIMLRMDHPMERTGADNCPRSRKFMAILILGL
jgi:hypothetical protein